MQLNLLPMMGVFTPDPYLSSPLGFYPDLLVVFGDSMKNLRKRTNILTIWILDLRFISEYLKRKTKTCHWYTPSPYEDLKFSNFFWNSDYIPHSSWYRVTTFETFTKMGQTKYSIPLSQTVTVNVQTLQQSWTSRNMALWETSWNQSIRSRGCGSFPPPPLFQLPWVSNVHVYQTCTIFDTLTINRRSFPGRKWHQSRPRW